MIVSIGDKKAVVLGYNSNNSWYCIKDGTQRLEKLNAEEISIKDPRIPNNWIITSYFFKDWRDSDWLIDDYNDYIFFCYPKSIKPSYLVELSYENINPEERTPFENYVMLKAMNEIRAFHGLPPEKISYIEEYELALMTPEQRRQKAMSDELDEYLRIGEEIEQEREEKKENEQS